MSANVQIDGYPPIEKIQVFQASDERPGKIIVNSMVVGPDTLAKMPRVTSLQIFARNFAGTWADIRLTKAPRVRGGYMRLVFEDSRWKLRTTPLHDNYNFRDTLGKVFTTGQKTITELAALLATATGLSIETGSVAGGTLPDFKPPARWAGVTADVALRRLLNITGCRFVYNPINGSYTISSASTGTSPDVTDRHFRPGPACQIKTLKVQSAPVLYEDRFPVKAVTVNRTSGALEDLSAPTVPIDPDDAEKQTTLRMWAPDGMTHPSELASDDDAILMPHRAKVHVYDPDIWMYERGRVIPDDWEAWPFHQPFIDVPESIEDRARMTYGGKLFVTDHPVLSATDAGELSVEAKLLTSYYVRENGSLKRNEKEISLNGGAERDLTIQVPWIRPVDSTESDMSGSDWDTLHQTVADAIAQKYKGTAQTVRLAAPIDLGGSGRVGAVSYELSNSFRLARPRIYFQVALDFTPGARGAIR